MDNEKGRTAVICGASGQTGACLLNELLQSDEFTKVICIGRKELQNTHAKLKFIKVDFDKLSDFSNEISGDDFFCLIGTTIKKAENYKNFFKVDVEYATEFAKIGKQNGANNFYLLSSVGANPTSKNQYLNAKGLLEDNISRIGFDSLHVFRPSLLLGKRNEFRLAEIVAKKILPYLNFLLVGKLRRYRAIESRVVAKAMCKIAELNFKSSVNHYDDMMRLANIKF